MPYITLDVDPNGNVHSFDADASIMPFALLTTGTQLITAQLISMIESGMPQSAVHNIGGEVCATIGKCLDQHKGT